MVLVVKNPPANAGDVRDLGSSPGENIRKFPAQFFLNFFIWWHKNTVTIFVPCTGLRRFVLTGTYRNEIWGWGRSFWM